MIGEKCRNIKLFYGIRDILAIKRFSKQCFIPTRMPHYTPISIPHFILISFPFLSVPGTTVTGPGTNVGPGTKAPFGVPTSLIGVALEHHWERDDCDPFTDQCHVLWLAATAFRVQHISNLTYTDVLSYGVAEDFIDPKGRTRIPKNDSSAVTAIGDPTTEYVWEEWWRGQAQYLDYYGSAEKISTLVVLPNRTLNPNEPNITKTETNRVTEWVHTPTVGKGTIVATYKPNVIYKFPKL